MLAKTITIQTLTFPTEEEIKQLLKLNIEPQFENEQSTEPLETEIPSDSEQTTSPQEENARRYNTLEEYRIAVESFVLGYNLDIQPFTPNLEHYGEGLRSIIQAAIGVWGDETEQNNNEFENTQQNNHESENLPF